MISGAQELPGFWLTGRMAEKCTGSFFCLSQICLPWPYCGTQGQSAESARRTRQLMATSHSISNIRLL